MKDFQLQKFIQTCKNSQIVFSEGSPGRRCILSIRTKKGSVVNMDAGAKDPAKPSLL